MGFLMLDVWRIEEKFVVVAYPEAPCTQITLFCGMDDVRCLFHMVRQRIKRSSWWLVGVLSTRCPETLTQQ
jgi:hypothetical protein